MSGVFIEVQGSTAGKYADRFLKAGSAAQPRARSACFGQVTAIYKHYYLAEGGTFLWTARYRADFLAVIENNRDFPLSPEMSGSPTIYVHITDQRKMLDGKIIM